MSIPRCAPTLLAAVLAAACHAQAPAALTTVASSVEPLPVATKAMACPSQDFDAFLAAFMESEEVQKAFTDVPLRSDSIDANAEPEPRVVTTMVSAEQMTLPVIPDPRSLARRGLANSSRREGRGMVLTLAKPDSGYQISYYFRLDDTCWHLYRKYDESI